ncbi:MAG: LysM peptidoglycan-binding domain-containing protein, partial [Candidatus Omnitrophica bacterium]|nr:LysM peptidoglycan-binding domain-containing protein [Candidatus Omnitrophota bacterium]
ANSEIEDPEQRILQILPQLSEPDFVVSKEEKEQLHRELKFLKDEASKTTTTQGKSLTYTVQKGDSLSKIAQRKLGNALRWKEIYELNKDKVKDPNLVYPGQELIMPQTAPAQEKEKKTTPAPAEKQEVKKTAKETPPARIEVKKPEEKSVAVGETREIRFDDKAAQPKVERAPPVQEFLKEIGIQIENIKEKIRDIDKKDIVASEKLQNYEDLTRQLSGLKHKLLSLKTILRENLFATYQEYNLLEEQRIRLLSSIKTQEDILFDKIVDKKLESIIKDEKRIEELKSDIKRYNLIRKFLKHLPISYPDDSHHSDVSFVYDVAVYAILILELGNVEKAKNVFDALYEWWKEYKNKEWVDKDGNKYK